MALWHLRYVILILLGASLMKRSAACAPAPAISSFPSGHKDPLSTCKICPVMDEAPAPRRNTHGACDAHDVIGDFSEFRA